jgi:predicted transcriptional regulator
MPTRINARLDDELAEKVERLRKKTGKTLTALVEAALEAYVAAEAPSDSWRAFEDAGFIGVGKGPRDLARNSKQALTTSLRKKS